MVDKLSIRKFMGFTTLLIFASAQFLNTKTDIFQGDSGSPLVKDGVQVGVASWVFTPCGSGYPDFYARVPNYVDWIKQKLGSDADQLQFVN